MQSALLGVSLMWLAMVVAALTSAAAVLGHGANSAYILIPVDHVNPGEPFEVIAGDMGPNATVAFRLERDEETALLSEATAGSDGHFTTTLTMPAEFPAGYAMLVAEAADGTTTSTWVLVGPRTSATPSPPGQLAWWSDPSVVVLGIAVVGGLGALGYALWRRGHAQRVTVAAGGSRRRSSGKAQRRATRRGQV